MEARAEKVKGRTSVKAPPEAEPGRWSRKSRRTGGGVRTMGRPEGRSKFRLRGLVHEGWSGIRQEARVRWAHGSEMCSAMYEFLERSKGE